jgi:hypothetical protein
LAQLVLKPGYFITARRLSLAPGALLKVADTLEQLRDGWADLPGPGDEEMLVPPTHRCWMRRVEGTSLVVCYQKAKDGVVILAVKALGA